MVRNIKAVRVQMTKVSKKISNTPHSPCLTGSRVSDAECAMTEEPKPASLLKTPRAIPFLMTVAKVKPRIPPPTALKLNALVKIRENASGMR